MTNVKTIERESACREAYNARQAVNDIIDSLFRRRDKDGLLAFIKFCTSHVVECFPCRGERAQNIANRALDEKYLSLVLGCAKSASLNAENAAKESASNTCKYTNDNWARDGGIYGSASFPCKYKAVSSELELQKNELERIIARAPA